MTVSAKRGPKSQEEYKTERGCGVIFHYMPDNEVLFMRRDDIPVIDFPGYLDLFGGFVEENENPDDAIVREIGEELVYEETGKPYTPPKPISFRKYVDKRGCEQNIYEVKLNTKPKLKLAGEEGQYVVWMNEAEIATAKDIAWDFQPVILDCIKAK